LSTSIRDVAVRAGVSIATVSRVMNGSSLVKREYREAVLRAARQLNYVPHAVARALITGRSRTMAVVLPDMHGEFFSELIHELDQCAHAHGQNLLVASLHGDLAEARRVLGLLHGQVDGVILMVPFNDAAERLATVPITVPTVLLNAPAPVNGCPTLTVDNAGGARQVVRHFVSMGYHTMVHIAGPSGNFDASERARGFRAAVAEAGLPVHRDIPGDYSERSGYLAGQLIVKCPKRPRAVFAANDNMAVGCLEALTEANVRVPEDIAVAGFDDVPIVRFTRPPLTSVRSPIAQQGIEAFEWLMKAVNRKPDEPPPAAPREQSVPTTLIVRGSTDPRAPTRSSAQPGR